MSTRDDGNGNGNGNGNGDGGGDGYGDGYGNGYGYGKQSAGHTAVSAVSGGSGPKHADRRMARLIVLHSPAWGADRIGSVEPDGTHVAPYYTLADAGRFARMVCGSQDLQWHPHV